MMNLFYRGYVIHEDIPCICYTIYGKCPERTELASRVSALESMHWIDKEIVRTQTRKLAEWPDQSRRIAPSSPGPQPAVL